jgi:hypothetical protein
VDLISISRSTFVILILFSLLLLTVFSLPSQTITVASAQTPAFNFVAAGDWGCTSHAAETAERMDTLTDAPERVIVPGDMAYKYPGDCWFDIIQRLGAGGNTVRIAFGNHDQDSSAEINQYLTEFNMDNQWHEFQYMNVQFLSLSTELTTSSEWAAQEAFAEDVLDAADDDPSVKWIVVFLHRPLYVSPTNHGPEATIRDTYHPMFEEHGVDLVLQAHNHNFERSVPLRYDPITPETPIYSLKNTHSWNDPTGQIFATVGTGGAGLYQWEGRHNYMIDQQHRYRGFMEVEVTDTTLTGTYYMILYNPDRLVVDDTFTITK